MTAHALPTGTVTFLLTDIEGSTALWSATQKAWQSAVQRHHEILDDVVVRHGGARPDEQGEGDSVVAVFVRASDAAAAALDAHRALTELGLAVRMALHTGSPNARQEQLLRLDDHPLRPVTGDRARRADPRVGRDADADWRPATRIRMAS